ncbi:hypothetical protein V1477_019441 [Vespula maculifrons]|uniref:Uncharacterized protein n=1 Tax=Vespula maculifrons TaxID=7453 RepID=A0ABD2AV73_VESMC
MDQNVFAFSTLLSAIGRLQALRVNKNHDTVIDLNILRQNMVRLRTAACGSYKISQRAEQSTSIYCYQYEYWWCAVSCHEVNNKFSSKSMSNFISQYVNKKREVRGEIPKGYTQCHVPAVFGHHEKYRDRGYYYNGEKYEFQKICLQKKLKRHEYVAKENKDGLIVLKWKDKL